MTSEELKQLQAKMPNDILIKKVEHQITQLALTGGKSHIMCVPPEITDTDMILSEMVRRFKKLESQLKEVKEENRHLSNYAVHTQFCAWINNGNGICDCGYIKNQN